MRTNACYRRSIETWGEKRPYVFYYVKKQRKDRADEHRNKDQNNTCSGNMSEHNATLDLAYRIVSVILNFVIVACVTWYNNDYTPEACEGTGLTRMLKSEEEGVNIGGLDYIEEGDEDE